jgi:phosphate-selective porin OprO and OprP
LEIDLQPTVDSGSSGADSRLLDWRISLEKFFFFSLRVGQWNVEYNRERRDSSGQQQLVERSIVNDFFTIDRQMGAMLYGRLAPGSWFDPWYYAAFLQDPAVAKPMMTIT